MNKTRTEWLSFLERYDYEYFFTVTFCKSSRNTDKDLERFIRIIHQNLFGRKFIKKQKLLGLIIVREKHSNLERPHFHILIEKRENMTKDELLDAIIQASRKCKTIKNLHDSDKDLLTTNHRENNLPSSKGITLNLLEIKEEDKLAFINYPLKNGSMNNYSNIHIATANNNNNYFPIITGVA